MDGWIWTWQDPVALSMVAASLIAAWMLRRRLNSESGCHDCPVSHEGPESTVAGASNAVALHQTRLGARVASSPQSADRAVAREPHS